MKKVLLGLLLVLTVTLTGCDQVEETVTDLQTKINTVTTDLETAVDTIEDLDETLETAETTINTLNSELDTLTTDLDALETKLEELETENADLAAELLDANKRIKNASQRSEWIQRKVAYNADFTSYDAEYCFGVYDVADWSTITDTPTDYTHNTGLKFVLTVTKVEDWGFGTAEVYFKDSCGNYSEYLITTSNYGLYSAPSGLFEVGKTYDLVLYKDVYMFGSPAQLGYLPEASLEGDFNSYPTDLSGIVATEQTTE